MGIVFELFNGSKFLRSISFSVTPLNICFNEAAKSILAGIRFSESDRFTSSDFIVCSLSITGSSIGLIDSC